MLNRHMFWTNWTNRPFLLFIFDGFEYLEDMVILRVNREEEFAPIKNEKGVDSPETAKEIYEKYFSNIY